MSRSVSPSRMHVLTTAVSAGVARRRRVEAPLRLLAARHLPAVHRAASRGPAVGLRIRLDQRSLLRERHSGGEPQDLCARDARRLV